LQYQKKTKIIYIFIRKERKTKSIKNKYKILDFIGNGNFGSVFLGETREKEKVAIKLEDKSKSNNI
jgi:hypothetical protein